MELTNKELVALQGILEKLTAGEKPLWVFHSLSNSIDYFSINIDREIKSRKTAIVDLLREKTRLYLTEGVKT